MNNGNYRKRISYQYEHVCILSSVVSPHKSYTSYINNTNPSCFSSFGEYTAVTRQPSTTLVRNPWAPREDFGLEKKFALTERTKFQFKAEAFNALNTPIFGGPNTGSPNTAITPTGKGYAGAPGSYQGYGTIGATQQNFPRQFQFSGKLLF